MAESTIGPQKAMRPVSLWASFRDEVRRVAPWVMSLGMSWGLGIIGSNATRVKRIFHVCLNETLARSAIGRGFLAADTRWPQESDCEGLRAAAGLRGADRAKQRRRACFLYPTCSSR